MGFIKLFEEFSEENKLDAIADFLHNSEDSIVFRTKNKIDSDKDLKSKLQRSDEGILTTVAIGLALSAGRIAHLTSSILSYLGIELGANKDSMINSAARWLNRMGTKYTNKIYGFILGVAQKVPSLKSFITSLDKHQRLHFASGILTAGICIIVGRFSEEVFDSVFALQSIDTLAFAEEFEEEIPGLIKATAATLS